MWPLKLVWQGILDNYERNMKTTLILVFLLASQIYFAQCDDPIVKSLTGLWVRDSQPTDTLRFGTLAFDQFQLILADAGAPQRGPAGLYDFRVLGGAMLVHWLLAGSSIPQ